ncbi:MAG: HAD family hydrolase [Bacilli bacterium]|nr:HAD family hydrolase [Bacilli bacterium]MDD3348375.1 HAD family hydrolase [Bacilli bacterium]
MDNKRKCVIFDLDGTLLNTIEDITDAVNIAYQKNGFASYSVKEVMYFVGSGVDLLVERSLKARGLSFDYFASIKKEYVKAYQNCQKNKTKPYPGIIDMLAILKNKGLKIAVISNKPQIDTEKVITHYFSRDFFDLVMGAQQGIPLKPNPEVVFKAMTFLQVSPKETIYVGDSDIDMKTAVNAKLESIGCTWGFRTFEELSQHQASYIVTTPEEIIKIIG